jgi:hypothetical protein
LGKAHAGDIGGPFNVVKQSAEFHTSYGRSHLFNFYSDSPDGPFAPALYHYRYPQYFRDPVASRRGIPAANQSTGSQLEAWGTIGISRTLPTKSHADFGTFIGELREGIPSAIGFAGRGDSISKKLASENLNYQFGLKPIVNDVQEFANVVRNSEKLLEQYRANAGKRLKRSVTLVDEHKIEVLDRWTGSAAMPIPAMTSTAYNGGTPTTYLERESKKRIWFEGCYTYFIPSDSVTRRIREADKLLGTTPDLAMLWNLTPWSWAVDWATNMGSIAENMSAFLNDGLVLHYGYVMEEIYVSHRYNTTIRYKSYPDVSSMTAIYSVEARQRAEATPYGFGVTWDGFSAKQLSILASLGITRGRR